jgi:uncharacterized protein YndB with AHSA1/START domain
MSTEMIATDSITIDAPPSRVWDTLVNPLMTRKYMFDCEALSDWKPGSKLEWKGATDGKVYVTGYVVEIENERLLRYTVFDPNGGLKDVPENYLTVSYTLSDVDGKTVLDVSQGDFAKAENGLKRYEETVNGWGMVMKKIKEIAEER